jgi:hypothetical protein
MSNIFERKLNYFGKNMSLLQKIHMKFLALEHKKGQKVLKSVSNSSRYLFASQTRRTVELAFCV